MNNAGIIRNRLKIRAAIQNAKTFLAIQKEYENFANYLWQWIDYTPIQNRYGTLRDLPAKTDLSETISKDLKKRGMNFVGPTIIYAFMQAIGMVNDHEVSCFRHAECLELANIFSRRK